MLTATPNPYHTPTMLLGHRGARGQWAENSLQGFINLQQLAQSAYNQQPARHPNGLAWLAGVEFDIQMTADDELVIYHDASLERLHGQQGCIRQLTLAECRRLSGFGSTSTTSSSHLENHDIITLTELMPHLAGYRHIEMEIKTHAQTPHQRLAQVLLRQLQSLCLPQPSALSTNIAVNIATATVLTSFDVRLLYWLGNLLDNLRSAHQALPPLKLGLLIESDDLQHQGIANVINMAKRLGCGQLGLPCQDITAHMIEQCHRAELAISAWTVNDLDLADWLIKQNINTIISDYPSRMLNKFA